MAEKASIVAATARKRKVNASVNFLGRLAEILEPERRYEDGDEHHHRSERTSVNVKTTKKGS